MGRVVVRGEGVKEQIGRGERERERGGGVERESVIGMIKNGR